MATSGKRRKESSTLTIPTVATLIPERFEGCWYELARIPLPLGRDLVGTSDSYSRDPKGGWKVVYEGKKGSPSGLVRKLSQRLRTPDPKRPGEMEMSFLPFVWIKYRIIHMSADGRTMIITSSSKRYLWLMARSRILPDKEYKTLVWRAKDMGFDTARLVKVNQSGFD